MPKTKKVKKNKPLVEPVSIEEHEIYKTRISLKCAGRLFKAEGDTLEDALNKIKVSGGIHKLGGVLIVEQGERRRTKILSGSLTTKLFGHVSNTAKLIGLKQVKQMFP